LVASPHQVWLLTLFLTNRTEPSRKPVFTLPEWYEPPDAFSAFSAFTAISP
jgi:hypothetical protein